MLQRFKIYILSKIHKRIYKPYESLDFLPIWNYKQVEKTNDSRYLIKGLDYEHLPNIYLNLSNVWEKIFNSFIDNANPEKINELLSEFKMQSYECNNYNRLILAFNTLKCYDLCSKEAKEYFINDVRSLGYKYNDSTENDYCDSILNLQKQIIGLKRNLDFKNSQKLEEIKKMPKQPDIEDTLTMFTDVFPGTIFNSKTLTCKQYLSYLKKYNLIATKANLKAQQQPHGG